MELPPPSPFAGLPSFEPDRVSPSPSLDGYRPASAGAEEFRWGLDQPAGRAGGASEARGAGAAAGRSGAAAARPCALPPRAPASSALGLQTGAGPAPTPAHPCALPMHAPLVQEGPQLSQLAGWLPAARRGIGCCRRRRTRSRRERWLREQQQPAARQLRCQWRQPIRGCRAAGADQPAGSRPSAPRQRRRRRPSRHYRWKQPRGLDPAQW
jgi:hypothetical protein